jgi:hypothetical protein
VNVPCRAYPVLGILRHAGRVHHAQEEQAELHWLKVKLGEQPARRAKCFSHAFAGAVSQPDTQAEAEQK